MTVARTPVSTLSDKGSFYTFSMEEKGSTVAPKGLPRISAITIRSETLNVTVKIKKKVIFFKKSP